MAYIYMVRCTDNSLYTGIARDLSRRMQEHYYKKKNGAKYTKSRQIKSLEMAWETEEWSHAAKLEFWIKQLRKSEKEALISHPERVNELPAFLHEGIEYQPLTGLTLEMCLEEIGEGGLDRGDMGR